MDCAMREYKSNVFEETMFLSPFSTFVPARPSSLDTGKSIFPRGTSLGVL
jgi:hypothetical protein